MNAVSGLLTPAPRSVSTVLADGTSIDKSMPGLVAFLIIAAMGLALWFLLKSMGKQLGRAKEHFEAEDTALAADAPTAAPAAKAEAVAEVPKQSDAATE